MTDPLSDQLIDTVGDQGTGRSLPRALTPFRTPAYRRLALALVFSTFAAGAWAVALVWEVIRIGGGPAQLSVATTAGAVGVLLPALIAGVVADRVPQKLILLVVAVAELAGMALIGFLSLAGLTEVWHLAAVSFTSGVGLAFYYPAYSAWLPALVPESDLQAVNGFEGMVRPTIGQAIGPGVAGVVVGAASPGAAFASRRRRVAMRSARAGGRAPDRRTPRARPRPPASTRSARRSPTCARASSTWSAPRGCCPRCCSRP